MDLNFLADYMVPVIVGICLCVGYIIKKWVKDVDNKYIPTINAVLGTALAMTMSWGHVGLDTVLAGLVSGLSATGLHQAFKQILENTTNKEEK